ncbi:hypothetical protein Arad_7153 [Rhizobium rhizogenes K84]|uniref:Uncharacterized protein n=1 Tax=Rhizobium rhizogenes (strain K84 / ATCC BAA-868) TaxID=311403 RepID=B9JM02_RHIR8|nr:hypothetical protein Arad_7153 [Rhizobium rhizogenes K84]
MPVGGFIDKLRLAPQSSVTVSASRSVKLFSLLFASDLVRATLGSVFAAGLNWSAPEK